MDLLDHPATCAIPSGQAVPWWERGQAAGVRGSGSPMGHQRGLAGHGSVPLPFRAPVPQILCTPRRVGQLCHPEEPQCRNTARSSTKPHLSVALHSAGVLGTFCQTGISGTSYFLTESKELTTKCLETNRIFNTEKQIQRISYFYAPSPCNSSAIPNKTCLS